MRLVHTPAEGEPRTLATRVEVADSLLSRARGFVGRRPPASLALVMRFDRQGRRGVHMVGVPAPLDVAWVCDGVVQRVATLRPWLGTGHATADTVVECRGGTLAGVAAGDRLEVTGDDGERRRGGGDAPA